MKIIELYNMLTYRPQISVNENNPEPSLADLISRYYKSFPDLFSEEQANELTVQYMENWYNKFMDKN